MKKLLSIILALCMCLSLGIMFTACDDPTVSYTVTETEWKINFNLTNGQTAPVLLSANTNKQYKVSTFSAQQTIAPITSYTLYGEGNNENDVGSSLLKVAPNGCSNHFIVNGSVKEGETGTFANTHEFYIGVTRTVSMYFPFANNYNDFTFDQTKNAYVASNITSTMVDEYDPTDTYDLYTKTAEVTFIDGYLNTVKVSLCDKTFTDVFASFTFTFSNINSTTVTL